MSKVKEWMGLYMWANNSRHKEIERNLSDEKKGRSTNRAKSIQKAAAHAKESSRQSS